MPTTKEPLPGNLLCYRIHFGTFSINATRRLVKILEPNKRFVVEGQDEPIVEAANILSVLTTIPVLDNATSLQPINK